MINGAPSEEGVRRRSRRSDRMAGLLVIPGFRLLRHAPSSSEGSLDDPFVVAGPAGLAAAASARLATSP